MSKRNKNNNNYCPRTTATTNRDFGSLINLLISFPPPNSPPPPPPIKCAICDTPNCDTPNCDARNGCDTSEVCGASLSCDTGCDIEGEGSNCCEGCDDASFSALIFSSSSPSLGPNWVSNWVSCCSLPHDTFLSWSVG